MHEAGENALLPIGFVCFFLSFFSFCSISGQTTKRLNSLLHILIDTTTQMFQVWLSLLVLFIAHRCFFFKKKNNNNRNALNISVSSKNRSNIIDSNLSRDDPGQSSTVR
jgi:hypothetical protein